MSLWEKVKLWRKLFGFMNAFGVVPERIGSDALFSLKIEQAIDTKIKDQALIKLANTGKTWPLKLEDAIEVIDSVVHLSPAENKLLLAAFNHSSSESGNFRYGGKNHSAKSFAVGFLRIQAKDFLVLTLPSPTDEAKEFNLILTAMKKAMLYGYAVPYTFNFVTRTEISGGNYRCLADECKFSELNFEGVHANHAALLVDYRAKGGSFVPQMPESFQKLLAAEPEEWLAKNSWGINSNSSDKLLLRRYPLPAFTVVSNPFFTASPRLAPISTKWLFPKTSAFATLLQEKRAVILWFQLLQKTSSI